MATKFFLPPSDATQRAWLKHFVGSHGDTSRDASSPKAATTWAAHDGCSFARSEIPSGVWFGLSAAPKQQPPRRQHLSTLQKFARRGGQTFPLSKTPAHTAGELFAAPKTHFTQGMHFSPLPGIAPRSGQGFGVSQNADHARS